jgi:hypothetical protein
VFEEPLFCFTSDFDWASDFCLDDLVGFLAKHEIVPTVFGTHRSEALERHVAEGAAEVGLHPNFLPGSSHGESEAAVIDHVQALFPRARAFRSHCFVDSTHIARQMVARGIAYDSNLCLYLQPELVPLRHVTGLVRFPVFWEDDCHWDLTGGDWDIDRYVDRFLTPGLKIINVHPFPFAANVTSSEHYLRAKPHITTLSAADVDAVRHPGAGTRTFVTALIEALADRRAHFHTLKEIYTMTTAGEPIR